MNSESKPEANQSEAKEREKDKKPEPTEDVEFNGEYTDSGDSEDSQCDGEDYDDNDANSQGDSGTNAKNKNQKKSAKKKVQKFKRVKQRLVMNVVCNVQSTPTHTHGSPPLSDAPALTQVRAIIQSLPPNRATMLLPRKHGPTHFATVSVFFHAKTLAHESPCGCSVWHSR